MSKHVDKSKHDVKTSEKQPEAGQYAFVRMSNGHTAIVKLSDKPLDIPEGFTSDAFDDPPNVYDEVAGYGDDHQAARALDALWKA